MPPWPPKKQRMLPQTASLLVAFPRLKFHPFSYARSDSSESANSRRRKTTSPRTTSATSPATASSSLRPTSCSRRRYPRGSSFRGRSLEPGGGCPCGRGVFDERRVGCPVPPVRCCQQNKSVWRSMIQTGTTHMKVVSPSSSLLSGMTVASWSSPCFVLRNESGIGP